MEPEGHLGAGQLLATSFAMVVADAFIFLPTMFAKRGGSAAWLLALLTALAAAITLLPAVLLARSNHGRPLPVILEEMAGPWLGTGLNLVLLAYWFGLTAIALRGFVETFEAALLPEMPPSFLVGIALLVMAYGSWLGIETLGRANSVVMPITLFALAVGLLLTAPRWNANLLWPLFGPGLPVLTKQAFGLSLVYGDMLLFAIYISTGRSPKVALQAIIAGYTLAAVSLAAVALGEVLLFGPQVSSQLPFTALSVERMVHLGRFIQRVEAVFVLFWCFAALSKLCLLFHGISRTAAHMLHLPSHRALIPALAVLVGVFALLPANLRAVVSLQSHWVPIWAIAPVIGVPLVGLVAQGLRHAIREGAILRER